MKKKKIVLALIAVLAVLVVVYLWGPSSVPSGQAPFVALSKTNFSAFENAFDGVSDAPRLVLLLSPT